MSVRVASCAYPIERLADFAAFEAKQTALVQTAAAERAELLVFPEYASVELGSLLPDSDRGELRRELSALQALRTEFERVYSALACVHGTYILAPSFPERDARDGKFYNRARLHAPSGATGTAEKLQMTRFEREQWGISPAPSTRVFETALGVIGVAICYDSEFPLLVRRQVALGAEIILVPSCTDTLAGYHRVALSCRARALENQCYVVQASTVGDADWSLALDHNRGNAALFGPVDHGFASDGIVAQGELDRPGWVIADLDLAALARVRATGQVTNHDDWDRPGHLQAQPERVRL
jgi:predicted amidohydrolase